ncbi:MAG: pimeloyl-ACP methyl ester esterase BioH [Methylococcales bacterium]|nr:pimeloyl-ACP methyl ester esterase BioH [Methylococcales bacterium]
MIKIHKEVYGQGRPVVLIHGWAMHTGIWRSFAQQLAQHYQVTCLDLPGHGFSDSVDPYTLEQISDALIESSPETPFCVLGWSLGASVALTMANRFPQRVESLMLLAGNPRFVAEQNWAGMKAVLLEDFANNLSLNCSVTLVRFLALQVNSLPNGKALLKELKIAIQSCDPPKENILQSALDILKNADLRADLMALNMPVSIIQGDKDSLIPVQVSQDIQKIQPACELNIISGAGHVPFLSHQSEVIEIIKRFV